MVHADNRFSKRRRPRIGRGLDLELTDFAKNGDDNSLPCWFVVGRMVFCGRFLMDRNFLFWVTVISLFFCLSFINCLPLQLISREKINVKISKEEN